MTMCQQITIYLQKHCLSCILIVIGENGWYWLKTKKCMLMA
jgi:hypothetical protein